MDAAGLAPAGAVRWGAPVPEGGPGVYVIAVNEDPSSAHQEHKGAPLDTAALEHLLDVRPELSLDGGRPTTAEFAERLETFWLGDEAVLYIGLAGTSLRKRVRQYYRTPLGARKPHAGGWWLKTLAVLDELWVHYAPTPNNETAETTMLMHFAANVSAGARAGLHDPDRPAPLANLRTGTGAVKAHGITGATGDLP